MKLVKARVQNYRSIRDTGEFEIEEIKTILVGPNEAGKTAILQALQRLNAPEGIKPFNPLRDYPRALYNDIATGKVDPAKIIVATGWFSLDSDELAEIPANLRNPKNRYVISRYLNGDYKHYLTIAPSLPTYTELKADLQRLAAHMDKHVADEANPNLHSSALATLSASWDDGTYLTGATAASLISWLESAVIIIDEDNEKESTRFNKLQLRLKEWDEYSNSVKKLHDWLPTFVLFSNIFRVKPNIHLSHLASRIDSGILDDDQYDYGNICLLRMLGFTAKKLSELGAAGDPTVGNAEALESYREQLDSRNYQLNAASLRLSSEIRAVWNPNENKNEASKLRLIADGQYLKVVVEDSIGVEVELDQRSEGFQWLVSFFIVFFSESDRKHANSILLLDEPGVSLHALKQRDFRATISKLAQKNQTIYTTHSPFMVGPDELDSVRVVEMVDRDIGTKVHTSITSTDPAALLPLQEALGYDLAQSLFIQQRNLICEGLTDYWYIDATAALLAQGGGPNLNDKIALIPSNTAGKVVYFATILTANQLKVAAILDSDNAGDQAAQQEILVHRLSAKRILRTADYTDPKIPKAEIEDLLRDTLVKVAKSEFSIDIAAQATAEPSRPLIDILEASGGNFSKYKLAKAYIRWTRDHSAKDLSAAEVAGWTRLIAAINAALK